MPFPSLISLKIRDITEETQQAFQSSLESFSEFSPNLKRLSIYMPRPDVTFSKFFSSYIFRWRDLHIVDCGTIALDADALVHLSRMPALTHLSCTPSDTFPPSDPPVFLTNLYDLRLHSDSLDPISQLLSRIRLPAMAEFVAFIESCPSKQALSSFLASLQTSAIGHTIQQLNLADEPAIQVAEDHRPVLGFEDLQPCMAFSNLCSLCLDLSWDVRLTDIELLALASAWPRLEHLLINGERGWNMRGAGGITPSGLLQLLQTCSPLREISLVIDTRNYTEFRESPAILELTLRSMFSINVIDSVIEGESVPAVTAFFVALAKSCNEFHFWPDEGFWLLRQPTAGEVRWYDVYNGVYSTLSQRS